MSLQFITGPSGCGKSHYIYQKLIEEAIRNPNERFLIVVPEQFSMQTQKELVNLHPAHALLNVDILSFNRLAYRVFAETGESQAPILEDTGKILVLQKLISENREKLSVLSSLAGKPGAAAQVNSQLSEFMQYRVDPAELDTRKMPELLKRKIQDLAVLSDAFGRFLQGRYLTAEEVPAVLSRVIEKYDDLNGATVLFDGFTGFVPAQYMVLEKLLRMCKKVIVVALTDQKSGLLKKSSPANLFHMTHEMAEKLTALADGCGVPVLPEIRISMNENSRFRGNEALEFLEKKLFRYEKGSFRKEQNSVFMRECLTQREEAEQAAQEICRLVRTAGYRFRDFAFVTADLQEYGETVRRIFEENGIPCFLDRKKGIQANPAVVFVRAAVELAAEDFSAKSVFRLLKTGMTDLGTEEVQQMENYVQAFRIRGRKAYGKNWTRTGRTIRTEDLPGLNAARERFLSMVSEFTDAFKEHRADVKTRTKALYSFICSSQIQKKCRERELLFEEKGENAFAREYAQVYRKIMDFLDKLVEIMGNDPVSVRLYRQLVEAGFSEMKLGIVPPGQDCVVIGDIERTRLENVKVLFFAGIMEGLVPKPAERMSVLSENDRGILAEDGVVLAPDMRQEMYRQRLYLYMTLTAPSDRLCLSWCRTDTSGEARLPSYLVGVIRALFPDSPETDAADETLRLETLSGRREMLTEGFRTLREFMPGNAFLELVSSGRKERKTDALIALLVRAVQEHCPDTDIGSREAQQLYGTAALYSATRLEQYGSCAFRHFLKYGLGLEEREIYAFSPADIGTILHEAIRLFCGRMQENGWQADEPEQERIAEEAFFTAYRNHAGASENSTGTFDRRRLLSISKMSAWCVAEQIRRGDFRPQALEERFTVEGVRGVIDRIDVCSTQDVQYVRVIDYKSGSQKPDLVQAYFGTQLQLPLYLDAACEMAAHRTKHTVEPAGIYYLKLDDPPVEVESPDEEVTPSERLVKLRMDGISRKEPEILQKMDRNLAPGVKSEVIPVQFVQKTDAQGKPVLSAGTRAMEAGNFTCLSRYTRYLLRRMRREIESGCARINPMEIDGQDSCGYCPYSSVCRFDERIDGFRKLRVGKKKDEEILQEMEKALREDG